MELPPDKVAVLRVERMALATLKLHPRNPRTHPEPGSPKWLALEKSLAFDYFDPIVVNVRNGMLVSGHFRLKVMLASGFTHADVSVVDYDEPTHIARLIAANQLLGEWEEEMLAKLAGELSLSGLDAGLAGLSEKELASYVDGPSVTDDTDAAQALVSEAEKIAAQWQVQLGDLYSAGEHRILCGDCTRAENWRLLLGDRRADMVWTDPPYNVDYADLMNDDLPEDEYAKFLLTAFATAAAFTKPGGAIYVAHADSYGLLNRQAVAAAGFKVAQCLIWVKNQFTLGRQDYQWQHEPVLYGWKKGAGHYWQGGFSQATVLDDESKKLTDLTKGELISIITALRNNRETTVVREARWSGDSFHPTVKPLALVARHIWNSSKPGDTVLELFGGSGTTILAAEQTRRKCVATELDPKFCAVILERLTRAGLKVEKVSDGHTH